ncbi:MAG: cation:proton antiporter [Methanosphaera sp.]|nr:cation:proton antiporter [Methanosphaera sp.]
MPGETMYLHYTLTFGGPVETILGIVFIILGIFMLIAAKGLLADTDDNLKYSIFARLEILGIGDIVGVLILILLGEPALGVVYFILAPFATHAIASGHFRGEQEEQ